MSSERRYALLGHGHNPITASETAASATVTNNQYPPGDIRRYGADVDTADNTTAIQDAINSAAHGGYRVFIPGASGGRYRFASTLYGFYHVTNNPNFPSGANEDGRLVIEGEGTPNKSNFTANTYRGSILEYTGTTGVGLNLYDDSGTESKAVVLRDFGLYANTSGYPLQMDRIPQLSIVENVFVGNDGSGGGIKIDTWASSLRDVWVYGNGSGSAIAFDTSDGGGNVVWENVNAENCDIGFDFGSAYDSGRAAIDYVWNHDLIACQAKTNRINYRIRHGVGSLTLLDCWSEGASGSTGRAIAISDRAGRADGTGGENNGLIKIIGGYLADTATDSDFCHIEIGTSGGQPVGPVHILGTVFGQVAANTDAIRIHNISGNGYRRIENPVFHNNSGQLIVIDAAAQYGTLSVINPETDGVNERNTIEDTSLADASAWANGIVEGILPLMTTTADYSNAVRLPSHFAATTVSGGFTLTLPTSPIEHTAILTKLNGTNTLTIARNGQNINGSAADFTTTSTYINYVISWARGYGWTIT